MSIVSELFSTFLNTGISVASLRFLVFIIGITVVYYLVPKKAQWVVLAIANTVFYIWGGFEAIFYLLGTVAVGYFGARLIQKNHNGEAKAIQGLERDQKKLVKARFAKKRKRIVGLVSAFIIIVLAVTKYTGFFLDNLNSVPLFNFDVKSITSAFPVVLGISYYTLSLIAYLMDVYRKKIKAEKNYLKLYLFISFFPHVIQGPIERYDKLAPQLTEGHSLDFSKLKTGAILIAWGFFKKLVIADRLAGATSEIFSSYSSRSGTVVLIGTILFSFQIYTDWTGYCDIVGGAAEMLGIKIMKNFDRPYFSQTMPEFWRRWHISMGTFFKDYVLYPVSTSRFCLKLNKNARKLFGNEAGQIISSSVPIFAVWFLTGFWHGGSWSFICWGIYQGILIILSVIFTPRFQKLNKKLNFKTESFSWKLFRMARTFMLCCLGRIFFNSSSVTAAFQMFARLAQPSFGLNEMLFSYGLNSKEWAVIIVSLLLLLTISIMQEKFEVRQKLDEQPILFKWPIIIALIVAIVIFGVYGSNTGYTSFVYEQF